VLDHPELARRLADTPILKQHELSRFLPPDLTARSVVKAGEQVFQPVPLGQVDWLGGTSKRQDTHPPEGLAKIGTGATDGAEWRSRGNVEKSPSRDS
jgi:hypothetical protein